MLKLSDIRAGDVLIADGGFTCLADQQACTVRSDPEGGLFVECDEGRHDLDGQLADDGEHVVGLSRVENTP